MCCRKFKREKFRHKTQAERQGYSWVLFSHAPQIATRMNLTVNPIGQQFWRAIKDARWNQVRVYVFSMCIDSTRPLFIFYTTFTWSYLLFNVCFPTLEPFQTGSF